MSSAQYGFMRIAVAAPELVVADVGFNTRQIISVLQEADARGAAVLLLPELCLTGYTCGDLFAQQTLISRAAAALIEVAEATTRVGIFVVVGLPWEHEGRLYNCAAVAGQGRVIGVVPKQFLPNSAEYYEKRWFSSGLALNVSDTFIAGKAVPFGTDLIFSDTASDCRFALEICEDLWAVSPPSGALSLAGANLILNPSASNELLGKANYRRDLIRQQSARCLAAYAYASSGTGESTTDVVFSGHCLIVENGTVLAEPPRFGLATQLALADIDFGRLKHERYLSTSFTSQNAPRHRSVWVTLALSQSGKKPGVLRPNSPHPFIPSDRLIRHKSCHEIFTIQAHGLAKRIRHTGASHVVIGISGGLDSTLALLVAAHAYDLLKLDRKGIIAVTMPGFGTTNRTRGNAMKLIETLGAELRIVSIDAAVRQHFADIMHDENTHDVTYENAQARERTQILMDIANQVGGFVVGTGDLSEAALGWCTFNGDHMSMYHVNIGIPKTLVRYLVDWCAESRFLGATATVLNDISATPISPELLPIGVDDVQHQSTEEIIGQYELHDFFLFHFLRYGCSPAKVLYMAELAFAGRHDRKTLLRWLTVFVKRFFSQQFKRSAMPDGPKVGTVALSPRGDWRMPSDASARAWLSELETLGEQAAS